MSEDLKGELVTVECNGSIIRAEKSERGFYICPVCKEAIFFSECDLMRHIIAHAQGFDSKRHRVPKR